MELKIKSYLADDFIDTLLESGYVVEIKKEKEFKILKIKEIKKDEKN